MTEHLASDPKGGASSAPTTPTIDGVLRDGLRVAAGFTELPWVRAQFRERLGLDIWPGTVNLQVSDPEGLALLARLRAADGDEAQALGGVPIEPPETGYCVGWCYPARLGPLPAAIVMPHVADYPPDKLELIAAVRVRDALGLEPGDRVTVMLEGEASPPHGEGAAR